MSIERTSPGGHALTARGVRTRTRLVAAARRVFDSTPFGESRILDIATYAGVSVGTFYTYFDAKEEIFREVAAEALADLSSAHDLGIDTHDHDPIGRVANATRQYFLACLRHATVLGSIEQLALADGEIARLRRTSALVGAEHIDRWIRDLQDRGICDPAIDARTTARALHTMNTRVAYDQILLGRHDEDVDQLIDAITRIWARTVGLER